MKYVAFLDGLGFKALINGSNQGRAQEIIRKFNQTVYNLWEDYNLQNSMMLYGITFSDSLVFYTNSNSQQELKFLIDFLIKLYRRTFEKCEFMLRGGIALGEFNNLEVKEFRTLSKNPIVGNGFIEAYLLESSHRIKGSKIIVSDLFITDTKLSLDYSTNKIELLEKNKKKLHEIKWIDVDYLRSNRSYFEKLIKLACDSKWLDHYYGTLETLLIGEKKNVKHSIFEQIISHLREEYKYKDLDRFIENFFMSQCSKKFKSCFLSLIRTKFS